MNCHFIENKNYKLYLVYPLKMNGAYNEACAMARTGPFVCGPEMQDLLDKSGALIQKPCWFPRMYGQEKVKNSFFCTWGLNRFSWLRRQPHQHLNFCSTDLTKLVSLFSTFCTKVMRLMPDPVERGLGGGRAGRGWSENGSFGGKFLEGENEIVPPHLCFNLCLKKRKKKKEK